MFRRVSALFVLALALVRTLLLRFSNRGTSLEQFDAQYGVEGLLAVNATESRVLSNAGRCTACGLCDAGEGERLIKSRTGYRGMMAFALSGARSMPDFPAVARSLDGIPDEAFSQAQSLCPQKVPLLEMASLVRSHARRIAQS